MLTSEALACLGLTWDVRTNPDAICQAWKQKIKSSHPDKSTSLGATQWVQKLNQAKDVLLSHFEDPENKIQQEAEEERKAQEKEEIAAKKLLDEQAQYEKEQQALKAEQQARRERYAKNRKKRAEGTRMHRRIEEYEDGRALVDEMRSFFKSYFVGKPAYMFMSQIMDLFIKSRDNTSELEKRLFHRHARRIFAATWPNAHYTKKQNKWSFYGIGIVGND